MNPQPTPAPIHDISGPVAFSSHELALVVGAAVAGVALLAFLGWFFFVFKRSKFVPSAIQVALAELATLRGQVGSGEPYAFAVTVSDVLRQYLQDGRGLPAGSQTSMEFLETVRHRHVFAEDEQSALAAFLEKADLIKFARWQAAEADCLGLVDSAERLVRSVPRHAEEVSR